MHLIRRSKGVKGGGRLFTGKRKAVGKDHLVGRPEPYDSGDLLADGTSVIL